ncbi:hypothetical protein D3C72_132390 [compost metagenome]
MHITYTILKDHARQRFFIAEGKLDCQKLRDVGRIFIHSMAWANAGGNDDHLNALKQKLTADLDAEIRLIETTASIAVIVGLKVIALKRAGEGNPPTFEGLSMTVRREGFPEEIWLEVERAVMPYDEDT